MVEFKNGVKDFCESEEMINMTHFNHNEVNKIFLGLQTLSNMSNSKEIALYDQNANDLPKRSANSISSKQSSDSAASSENNSK